ncbi:MAG: hypothetical protein JXP36_20315 [Bacteroidales bacterium]|nr:hypothetical protein [Bacteroidales bacterium]
MDFTIKAYQNLLNSLQDAGFFFQTFSEFLQKPHEKVIILRHDVDLLPENSLRFAKIQVKMGIKGSYYFRAVPESWDEDIIKEIASLGHEVGYHYENMDTASMKHEARSLKSATTLKYSAPEKLIDLAYEDFLENLAKLRKLVEVKTICMHGSPRAKYDNKAIWEKYKYKELGIIGEPYYDMNFDEFFYLTDTGRRWDGWKTSVRDKVPQQEEWVKQGLVFHSTKSIIQAAKLGTLPSKIMFTFHPQRWHDSAIPWVKEWVLQNLKNQVKRFLVRK